MRSIRRIAPLALTAALLASTSAIAAEFAATSKIDAVTVFPSGAEISRLAKISLPSGEHVVTFADLPADAIASSIRVEGKATGRLEIGSVDTRRRAVPRQDPKAAETERRRLELEIERLHDEAASVQADVQAAETQKKLLDNLAALPAVPVSPATGVGAAPVQDWNALLGLIGSRTAEVQRNQLQAGIKVRALERRIKDLQGELASIAPSEIQRTEVKVHLAAGSALEADLVLLYQVPNASWQPSYDARLATGSRTKPASMLIARRATIQQRTGEPWDDVTLVLSTTRPTASSSAPGLMTWTIDFEPDAPPPQPRPAPMVGRSRGDSGAVSESLMDGQLKSAAAAPAAEPVMERRAAVELAPFQALFGVPGRATVPPTGEAKRVQIDETAVEPSLVSRVVPRVDQKAFLYAKLKLPKGATFLPGPVSLFRDATFVGTGRLPLLAGGDEHELGFGSDDAIKTKYVVAEEKRSESGIISTSKVDARNYRIIVKSLHAQPMPVTVMDNVPVAQHQDIKIDTTLKPQPTRRDVDERRGVLAWDMTLAPEEEKTIEVGYRIAWPAAKNIQHRR